MRFLKRGLIWYGYSYKDNYYFAKSWMKKKNKVEIESTFFEFWESVFWDVFVAQKNQLILNFIFCEIKVVHISCKTEKSGEIHIST